MSKPRIITICCSTKYRDKIIDYYNELTEAGYIVLADLTEHDRQDKFDKDVYYVDHVTFLMDWKIIFKTIKTVLKKDGITSDTSVTMEEFKGNDETVEKNG